MAMRPVVSGRRIECWSMVRITRQFLVAIPTGFLARFPRTSPKDIDR